MKNTKQKWIDALGHPSYEMKKEPLTFVKRYEYPEFDLEMYTQKNDPETVQRIIFAFPKNIESPRPAVAIPFYFPEAMIGFNPETNEVIEKYKEIDMMIDLVKKGYITASAEAYYLTYTGSTIEDHSKGFALWKEAGTKLREKNPGWSGMGKLVADTMLLIDALDDDERVDGSKIGIAGHSLGGKMAFYTGCLDERIKVILASDFGIGWNQTNWRDIWYWHTQVEDLIEKGMDHTELLESAAPKPFCLIAGEFDDDTSWDMMCKASGYTEEDGRLKIINHATGHRPPQDALSEGYDFIEKWL